MISRAAESWPAPPSTSTRSGRANPASSPEIPSSSSFTSRAKRRRSTSFIIPKSSPGVSSVLLMLNFRYWLFWKPSGPATIMPPTAFVPMMWLLSYTSIRSGWVSRPKASQNPRQQLGLGRALRHFPAQRLAGVGVGVIDQLALLAALGPADLHLAARLLGEGFLQKLPLGGLQGHQDQLGDRLVVVELAQEGAHDVGVLVALVDAGEVGAVAPVLAGAEEEDLDTGLAALGMEREDVGLLQGLGIDLGLLGHRGQGADAVAQAGGDLELHVVRGLLHRLGHPLHHGSRAATQEVLGLVDQAGIVLDRDQAGAGRCAALDLVQHAGARAALIDAVRARAEQERLLQSVERLVDRIGGGEGPEVVALDGVGAAVLSKLSRRVLPGGSRFPGTTCRRAAGR